MMRSRWPLPIVVFAVCAVATVAAGQAPPAGVQCGGTITVDTTLDRDLTGCANNGVVIGADGITLDLGGHTLAGDGDAVKRCPRGEACDIGVFNGGHDGVIIRNGSVRGFGVGVDIAQARENLVTRISSSKNQFFGFVFARSATSVIRDSSGNDNPRPDGDGLGVFASHDLHVVNNSFRRNGQLGMHIEGSVNNLIERNQLARNGDFGILLNADRNRVRGNRSVRDGVTAIAVGPGSRNVIAGNRIFRGEEGIAIEKGVGNVVTKNVIVGVRHAGIRLGIDKPAIGSTRTVLRGNLVRASGGDGFLVAKRDKRALLERNVARDSGDDGFDIESSSARLRNNRAIKSADVGVESVPGVVVAG